jgi:hypothetical protein
MSLFFETTENKDAARRIRDGVSLHLVAATDIMDVVGKWCVFALRDGQTDHTLYDSKDDAVRSKSPYEKDYCYLKITPDGITANDAWRFLNINRHPMIDTTAPEHVLNPAIFPRFSNMTPDQKRSLKAEAERQAKNAR